MFNFGMIMMVFFTIELPDLIIGEIMMVFFTIELKGEIIGEIAR